MAQYITTAGGSATNHNTLASCTHCGGYHMGQCSRIKSIEYRKDGTIKRVEYHDSYPLQARGFRLPDDATTTGALTIETFPNLTLTPMSVTYFDGQERHYTVGK